MPISSDQSILHIRVPNETDADIADILKFNDNSPHGVSYYLDKYPGSFTGTKKFCIVRNTWDRFAYFFECVKESSDFHDHDLLKDLTFEEFVDDFAANRDKYKNPCWHPQTAWIWTAYGPIVNHIFVEDPEYLETPQVSPLSAQVELFLKLGAELPEIDREAALERRQKYYTSEEIINKVAKIFEHEIKAFSFTYESPLDDAELDGINMLEPSQEDLESLKEE